MIDLRNLQKSYRQRSSEISIKWNGQRQNQEDANSEMMKELRIAHKQVFTGLSAILRPEQFRRLRQIQFQNATQVRSLEPLAWNSVMTQLDLSPDEQLRFEQKVKARSEALKKTNVELQGKVPLALARLVTPEQRQKLNDLCGEPIKSVEFQYFMGDGQERLRGGGMSRILMRVVEPSILKELEVLDEQAEQLSALSIENSRAERNILSKRRRAQVEATRLRKDEELEALREQFDKKVAEILLPHQVERLRQIEFQYRVRAEANIPLLSKTAATAICLAEEKQAELKEAYAREYQVLLQERDRVYYEALDELLETLSPEQQKRYHLLVGKRFDKWFQ